MWEFNRAAIQKGRLQLKMAKRRLKEELCSAHPRPYINLDYRNKSPGCRHSLKSGRATTQGHTSREGTTRQGEKSEKTGSPRSKWVQQDASALPQQLRGRWCSTFDVNKTLLTTKISLVMCCLECITSASSGIRGVTWSLHSIQLSGNLAWLRVSLPPATLGTNMHPQSDSPSVPSSHCLCINWHFTPHIPTSSSSSSSLASALPSLFFHSLRCQELNDAAELTRCYGNRLVIGW